MKVYQLNEEQANLISSDLAALIGKFEGEEGIASEVGELIEKLTRAQEINSQFLNKFIKATRSLNTAGRFCTHATTTLINNLNKEKDLADTIKALQYRLVNFGKEAEIQHKKQIAASREGTLLLEKLLTIDYEKIDKDIKNSFDISAKSLEKKIDRKLMTDGANILNILNDQNNKQKIKMTYLIGGAIGLFSLGLIFGAALMKLA